ncbi:MAG TPA: DUF4388 domain-containing protein [Thermoanaerobaculia bacterium]|nr:DUF4388 domain-containing protein [Thermoanaerobaculia bacterium]
MLEGEIGQIQLIERLVELWREQFTGAIRFENDGIIKIIYFKGGDILSASTNDRSDSIDEILMRAGKVSREHVKQALAKRKESETLGDALLNLGFITRKELTWARRVQVVGVIRSIAAWTDGSFTIVADYLPKRDEGTLFPLPQVLVELIVTEQDRARFEQVLDGGEAVFTKTADFDDVWRRLGLNEDAEAIAVEIDGTKTAGEVATASNRDTFNVYKLLHALSILRILSRAEKPQAEPQFALDDFATAGVADAADLWNDPAPAVAATPEFELDTADEEMDAFAQAPTMPGLSLDDTAVEPLPHQMADEAPLPAASVWDEPDELPLEPEPVGATPAPMPTWDTPPRDARSVPVQTSVEAPAEAEEEPSWGFDEAQLETARRAEIPAAAPAAARSVPEPEAKRGRYGLVLALLTIAILGAAGYFGFLWWQRRQESGDNLVAQRPARRDPGAAPLATTPPAIPATETTSTAAAAPAVITPTGTVTETAPAPAVINPAPAATTTTTAAAAPPAPMQITAAPPATSTSQALPRVTARVPAGRERIDAMAREYAANPTGNYTVQIQILCDPANLEKAIRDGGENLWFVPQTLGQRSCYRVFWGHFDSRAQAQQALAQVPASLRDKSSAVKAVPK